MSCSIQAAQRVTLKCARQDRVVQDLDPLLLGGAVNLRQHFAKRVYTCLNRYRQTFSPLTTSFFTNLTIARAVCPHRSAACR